MSHWHAGVEHQDYCMLVSSHSGPCLPTIETATTTLPDFTEQARQLVHDWIGGMGKGTSYIDRKDLWERIASALAEAATQGQQVGIELAARVPEQHLAKYDDHYMHCLTKCIPEEIRALSPDPFYIDRVRAEAATAALEQERKRIRKIIEGSIGANDEHAYRLLMPVLAAIGDDKEQQR